MDSLDFVFSMNHLIWSTKLNDSFTNQTDLVLKFNSLIQWR